MDLIAVAVIAVLFVWLFKKFTKDEDSLSAQGIRGPKGLPFLGSLIPLLTHKEGGNGYFNEMYMKFKDDKYMTRLKYELKVVR